jgi:hypothetical protein
MDKTVFRPFFPDHGQCSENQEMSGARKHPLLEAADLLILALWVAVCAMTPEFIWRGGRIALEHVDEDVLATALLFGLILAFCIEPALERLRDELGRSGPKETKGDVQEEPRSLLLTAGVGLVFAIASICLHDAISAFLAGHEGLGADRHIALVNGLKIAIAWAIVPFCVTLAWVIALVAGQPWRWIGFGLAAMSPLFAGWLFSWSVEDWVTTTLPALAILLAGWRHTRARHAHSFFHHTAMSMCWIAPLWLFAAALISFVAHLVGFESAALYTPSEFWIDARFYLGWTVGLLIVPDLPQSLVER